MLDLLFYSLPLCAISWTLWILFQKVSARSSLRGLPALPRESFIYGNLKQLYDPSGLSWHHDIVKKYGRAFKVHALFGDQQVYVTDPKALNHILVKDQYIYEETSMFIESNKLVFGDGLLSTLGDKHKKQRKLLNPVFSIAHMRNLPPIFYQITRQLRALIAKKVENGPQEIDMLHWMSRAALEYIGQGGLGYSFRNLDDEGEPNEYSHAVRDFTKIFFPLAIYRQFLPYLVKIGSRQFRRFLIGIAPFHRLRQLRDIVDVMDNTSKTVFANKKAAVTQSTEVVSELVGDGKDIMSVLIRANSLVEEADRLPEHELLAQMTTLIFAAHDTTSTSLSRMLHVLALHPAAQAKLREEVTAARLEHGDLAYDALMALPYLDAVVRESLRLYAPVTFVCRTTRQDIVLPLGSPIKSNDGKTDIHEIPLKKNTNVIVGLGAVNCDHEIWGEDAPEWKPERWVGKKLEQVASVRLPGVYSGMMTFLGGGRACIGFKFSELEMKIVLSMLLEQFSFEVSDKEILWRNSGIATPTTRGRERDPPHLPLKVSKVKSNGINVI